MAGGVEGVLLEAMEGVPEAWLFAAGDVATAAFTFVGAERLGVIASVALASA